MTATSAPLSGPSPRRLLRVLAAALCVFIVLSGAVLALYLSRPKDGLGHDIIDAIEMPFDQSEGLRYNTHLALGKILSLCPCTAGLSRDQYRRASFHRPHPTNAP